MGMLNLLFFCDNLGYHVKVKNTRRQTMNKLYIIGAFLGIGAALFTKIDKNCKKIDKKCKHKSFTYINILLK